MRSILGLSATLVCATACAGSPPSSEPRSSSTTFSAAEPVSPLPDPTHEAPAVEGILIEPAADGQPVVGTGIPTCDAYLDLYARCEQHLMPEIMAGDRRFHRAEAASLRYLAGTPEAAGLPSACQAMLDALRVDCPEQHRRR